jgi:pimeloyl-ACP methyl ester carboxylesterase
MATQRKTIALESSPFEPQWGALGGLKIRYAAQDGKKAETVLLLSPWPESIYALSQMWQGLASRFNLVALDLPGFGQSEGRADLMSPKAMRQFVAQAVVHFGLRRVHAVGPDIGTSALLFAAQEHPESFQSLVIGSGAAVFPLVIDGLLKTLVETEAPPPADPASIIGQFVDSIRNYTVPDYVRSDYLASYAGERFAFSGRLVRQYPTDLAALAPLLPSIATPVQIVVGRDDPYGLAKDAEILKGQLRHSRLDILECGHCAWEEQPAAYERIITNWVNGGFRDA